MSRDYDLTTPRAEEWLLIDWPEGDGEPLKYWLSTLAADASLGTLVSTAKLRWRIERDYQELKQELGLDHYVGSGWRGFHHHTSLCIAAYGFLISQREAIPPQCRPKPKPAPATGRSPRLSTRGAADPTRVTRAKFDRYRPKALDRRIAIAVFSDVHAAPRQCPVKSTNL